MRVHSTKYDGRLHYRYETTVVRTSEVERRLFLAPGTPLETYRGDFPSRYPTLQVYFADRPYNLHLSWHLDGRLRHYYVNVASVASWDHDVLRFVDLDLDVIWDPVTGRLEVDDEDEFEDHRVAMGYPEELVRQALATVDQVRDHIARRVFPFDRSLEAPPR